jgi:hypothetical protein
MTSEQIHEMFPGVPESLFRVHNWRSGITTVGTVPAEFVKEVSGGAVEFPWPAQVANLLATGGHDLVLSIGQVVPHEVIGMAIQSTSSSAPAVPRASTRAIRRRRLRHGAPCGPGDTPVRRISTTPQKFLKHIPLVSSTRRRPRRHDGQLKVRGLFVGDDQEVFNRREALARGVTSDARRADAKAVVFAIPRVQVTWLGNKAIYAPAWRWRPR